VPQNGSSFFQLKAYVENLLLKFGIRMERLKAEDFGNDLIAEGLVYSGQNNREIVELGLVSRKLLKEFDIENPVYYADFNFDNLLVEHRSSKTLFSELPKYPEVRRDLALLIDKSVRFGQISELAYRMERKLLRHVDLFDVYEGKGVPDGKKSYAVSFILRDDEKTLNDKQIEKIMEKLIGAFEKELGAQLR
ncbi:MAG: phenylalanine--tRNA ligase subunit beta, partial [Mangrovibacterium sp.]